MDKITIIQNDLNDAVDEACKILNISKEEISYSITGCTNNTITIKALKKLQ